MIKYNKSEIDRLIYKYRANDPFTREELIYLYSIEDTMVFHPDNGWQAQDDRVGLMRGGKNWAEDMAVVLGCSKEQVAKNVDEIRQDTKAYVGELVPGVFTKLPSDIEYVNTYGQKNCFDLAIGGNSARQLETEMLEEGVNISKEAHDIMTNPDFKVSEKSVSVRLIKISRFYFNDLKSDLIYGRAKELGLELCPEEVAVYYRLQYTNQPEYENVCVCAESLSSSGENDRIFVLENKGGILGLSYREKNESILAGSAQLNLIFKLPGTEEITVNNSF